MGKFFSRPRLLPSHRKSDERSPQGSNPLDANATVPLPPEVLDKILDHIPTDEYGRRTLIACALVATWWSGPSQRRLFSSVEIHEENYERWMKGVVLSKSKANLLEHVHSLRHSRDLGYRMRHLPRDSGKYLPALRNLYTLALCDTRVESISEAKFRTCFSAFRETLTYLSLDNFTTSFGAFVTLVDYFPNVTALRLHLLALKPDKGPVPSLSRPLRGKLHVREVHADCLEFLDRFAGLDQEYEELVIDTPLLFVETKFMAGALQISTSTVKFLRLAAELQFGATVTICDFQQLQELELGVNWPNSSHEVLLSSITSTELRRITFRTKYMHDWRVFAGQIKQWALIDEQLCGLVDRLRGMGYHHTLEAELRFTKIGDDPEKYDFAKILPEFRRKGVVTVIDAVHGDRLLHSSAHYH